MSKAVLIFGVHTGGFRYRTRGEVQNWQSWGALWQFAVIFSGGGLSQISIIGSMKRSFTMESTSMFKCGFPVQGMPDVYQCVWPSGSPLYEEAFVARPNESMTAAMAWGGRAQMMADR